MRSTLPTARTEIVLTELDGEALIYDFESHHAHCVNADALRVFRLCDGKHSVAQIAEALSAASTGAVSHELVEHALSELSAAGLLVEARRSNVDHARRKAMKQLAATVGLAVAVPMVWSIVAPTVAEAASMTVACMGCTSAADCCGSSGTMAMQCTVALACSGLPCSTDPSATCQ